MEDFAQLFVKDVSKLHPDFEQLQQFVNELNSTNSSTDKVNVIKKHKTNEFIKKILFYVYNPYYQFNVTSKNCIKIGDKSNLVSAYDIFELLDVLRNREKTGHDAIYLVNAFILEAGERYRELIYNIIDKDLKTRTGDKIINKAIPGLIPSFSVSLGYPINKYNPNFETERWYSSVKLDGVRCVTIFDENGDINFYSREGNEFTQLDILKQELLELGLKSKVFDGELCIMNNGKEDFKAIVGEVKRKDHQIQNPKYFIFDYLDFDEFNNGVSSRKFSIRISELCKLIIISTKYYTVLDQQIINSQQNFEDLFAIAKLNEAEGLIIREDVGYEAKRSKHLLKVKQFHDDEFIVLRTESGPFRVIDKDSGLERTEETLAKVYIDYKGNEVGVGSGFSLEDRRKYYEQRINKRKSRRFNSFC
jgi:DNA ligase-1